ncbi:Xanthine dehydrogenase/oxidase [Armadillidium nasatum]|uniref:xanthine dehydrogenase n=1 Tax=Armadillidium nasatum TaxID=96803 RepID=A0A5N5TC52_9CRUS|nr:Xanthine dehydrogenase/oxidase [Armadillidium nasatum]
MVSKLDQKRGSIRHYSINACLASIGTMHGLAVTTVEGVGSTKTRLHPVQERLAKAHGTQCGFCTPGFVMSMYTLLRNNPEPTMEEIELNLVGNLCRCTGYRPILEGFRTFSKEYGCGKENCCRLNNIDTCDKNMPRKDLEHTAVLFDPKSFAPYDPTQDLIFPPDLQSLLLKRGNVLFHKVASLTELLQLKHDYPEAEVAAGNTMKAFARNTESETPQRILYSADITDLKTVKITDSYVEMGSSLTISDVEEEVNRIVKQGPDSKIQNFRSMLEMLPWFADRQIKNVATLGGNVMSYFSISDFNCILMASEATLVFRSRDKEREIKADGEFFQRKRDIVKPDEVIVAIRIPFIKENEFFKSLKHSKRRGKDLSVVNAAMKVTLEFPSLKIKSLIMAIGGVSRTTIMADKTMAKAVGLTWDETFLETGISHLIEETRATMVSTNRSPEYKISLIAGFFFKFYFVRLAKRFTKNFPKLGSPLKLDESDIILPFRKMCTKSLQFFQDVPEDQEKIDPVGRPIPHVSALKQTTGEAIYVDDLPSFENELHAALVLSEKAHANIVSIDPSEALKMEGVEGFFSAKDVSDSQNQTGFVDFDEEIFASSKVQFVGQIIGIVVAETQKLARLAARKVVIKYEDCPNAILSIEKAIEENSVWEPFRIQKGNIEKGFENSKHILEGEFRTGGQEHLYLETNGHIVIPSEDGEIEVIGAMQAPSVMQKLIAKFLEVDINRVTCKTKRMGGAFGGKTSRSITCALPVAFAAVKTQRPVRNILTRSEDMILTGGRHPTLTKWKVGFGDDGQLHALDVKYYLNCGYAIDLSEAVLEKVVFHADNVYKINNLNILGHCCKTNMAPNTSFRALAMPQVIFVIENIVSQVADYLHKSSIEIREKNMYPKTKYTTHFGQELTNITVRECWDQIISSSNYEERKRAIETFNRHNRYKKRGIAVTPFKYPIGFSLPTLCQGAALIHVYLDGSVLLSHGGVEYGQGLHTKMLQVASRALKIPISKIYIAETNTDKVPNASTTAASAASDLSGMAVLNACTKISTRLAPYRNSTPQKTWEEAVSAAYTDRVPLSATGFYKIPGVTHYDFKEAKPASPYSYYSYGASVSEVEINCLTGEHSVLRADIIMDAGKSINPGIDIGQIEGAFAQGYGLVTLEQLFYSSSGELITKGPNAYKLPCVMNIPREFYVTLLRDSVEERAVYSSKATGEPSVLAGVSVFLAIREAIKAARKEDQLTVPLHSPATSETIRMACEDWITSKVYNK